MSFGPKNFGGGGGNFGGGFNGFGTSNGSDPLWKELLRASLPPFIGAVLPPVVMHFIKKYDSPVSQPEKTAAEKGVGKPTEKPAKKKPASKTE